MKTFLKEGSFGLKSPWVDMAGWAPSADSGAAGVAGGAVGGAVGGAIGIAWRLAGMLEDFVIEIAVESACSNSIFESFSSVPSRKLSVDFTDWAGEGGCEVTLSFEMASIASFFAFSDNFRP